MRACTELTRYRGFSAALKTVCSTDSFLPQNPCRGETVFHAFLAYPEGDFSRLSDLVRGLAGAFGNSECAVFKPIEAFGCSDEEFIRERGELPLVFFDPEKGGDLDEAWSHGTPPSGVYQSWDAVVCGGEVDWFMYFQYDFNAGVLCCKCSDHVKMVLDAATYPLATTASAASDEELVWPDGYSDSDRAKFYRNLKTEFAHSIKRDGCNPRP